MMYAEQLPHNDNEHRWRSIGGDQERGSGLRSLKKRRREIREQGPHPGFHFRKIPDFMDTLSRDSKNTAFYCSLSLPLSLSHTLPLSHSLFRSQ